MMCPVSGGLFHLLADEECSAEINHSYEALRIMDARFLELRGSEWFSFCCHLASSFPL